MSMHFLYSFLSSLPPAVPVPRVQHPLSDVWKAIFRFHHPGVSVCARRCYTFIKTRYISSLFVFLLNIFSDNCFFFLESISCFGDHDSSTIQKKSDFYSFQRVFQCDTDSKFPAILLNPKPVLTAGEFEKMWLSMKNV